MNKIELEEFYNLIEEYKKTGNKTIEIKVSLLDNILNKLKEDEIKGQILLVQKYNLIIELKNKGVTMEEIKKILDIRSKGE